MLIVVSGPKVSLIWSIDLTISASTRCVSSSISPSSTARLMKVPGAWITPSSSRSRTSASMPLTAWVLISTLAWKAQQKRFSRMASRSDCSIFIRASASLSMLESKNAAAALAAVLDAVHRDVGVLAQRLVAPAVFGIEADADRGGSEDLGLVDEERRLQPLQHEVDIFGDLALALDRIEQQQEFVAADPRQHVGFAQDRAEPLGDFHQQRVADRVAVIVVDVLEIVDVEEGEREMALRARRACSRLLTRCSITRRVGKPVSSS